MELDRRQFTGRLAMALPAVLLMPDLIKQTFLDRLFSSGFAPGAPGKTLVVVQMAGGNDGLNTLVPYSDPRYYEYRPNLAVAKDKVIPLNAEIGLHPALQKFKSLWDQKLLAVVEGVGYPNPNYSHFESMRVWQTASPDGSLKDGWLGRYFNSLDTSSLDNLYGLSVNSKTPPELYSDKVPVPVLQSIPSYNLQSDPAYPEKAQSRINTLVDLYGSDSRSTAYSSLLDHTVQVFLQSARALSAADRAYKTSVTYPDTDLGRSLRLVAEAVIGNLGVRVAQVSIGSFDTHYNQEANQERLFTELSGAISAFFQDLKLQGRDGDVLMMTWSEFGRRVRSNASNGTDHGSAAPLFVIGQPVSGGLYGRRCDLGNLDNGNLRFTTDFRSVYATILEKWLGLPSDAVLGKHFELLDFIS